MVSELGWFIVGFTTSVISTMNHPLLNERNKPSHHLAIEITGAYQKYGSPLQEW